MILAYWGEEFNESCYLIKRPTMILAMTLGRGGGGGGFNESENEFYKTNQTSVKRSRRCPKDGNLAWGERANTQEAKYERFLNVDKTKQCVSFNSEWRHRYGVFSTGIDCFKGNTGETPEKRGVAHMGVPERIDTILN